MRHGSEPGEPLVAVLDYGIGNLRSAEKALCRVGAAARLTDDAGLVRDAVAVVLPGVGAFGACLTALRRSGLEDSALDAVASGRPFLGICIGMQLLFETSDEDPAAKGLGVIAGGVEWIPGRVKRPQMQWNRLHLARRDDPAFAGVPADPWMYFVHSLHGVPADPGIVTATCDYGGPLTAVVRRGNVLACQFHPEKSGRNGLAFLRRFVASLPGRGVMDLYPSIDVRGGNVVRLRQGDYAQETVYGDDPAAVAASFADAGARWVHLVDLDAARTGQRWNHAAVAAVAAALAGRARLQVGGGVREVADARALAEAGVDRVVMGSAAVRHPKLVAAVAEVVPVAVGLDHRAGELAVHGWTAGAGLRVDEVLDRYPAATAFVVTDIGRDGTLEGPDVAGLAVLAGRSPVPIIASGGVASLDDLRRLAGLPRLAGVITGTALYEGRFGVADALAAVAPRNGTA